ncbi:Sporulation/cell division region, bacteria domain protein [Candidatus Magnetobacterium bavaricum]|uniref:Sporulation/cell division region, bacteria domain protein n=1 Tax=Candidatus Magnetobacterium bavaricum TaxID=29290 RepID=A0A0F3GKC2_9BACT|nr:Sporulation/cell division region, bacteria domain protein [Candidatus Magnetobacterium bavaricum]
MSTFDKFSQSFMEGKGLLIVVMIVFSSFSFVVGFFAGKKLSDKAASTNASTTCTPDIIARNQQQPPMNLFNSTPIPTEPAAPNNANPIENLNKKATKDLPPDITDNDPSLQEPEQTPPPKTPTPKPDKTVPKPTAKASSATPDVRQPQKKPAEQQLHVVTHEPKASGKQAHAAGKERYVIQVGAFKSLGEAMRLQEELKQKGFDSNISKHPIQEGMTLYKVRLDYANSKDDAISTLSRLNKKGITGFIKGETQ